jgi:hypothetical protein
MAFSEVIPFAAVAHYVDAYADFWARHQREPTEDEILKMVRDARYAASVELEDA